ncbi:hypothetical protein B0H13DRAFT_2334708 [Mycena leptocephala]|nr:hypothetical protein B0H13DRAFT_2334708 [Mycena leptocephala]
MFSTRPIASKPTIKVEESQCKIKPMESTQSGTNMPRKRARKDDEPNGTLEATHVSGRVKAEEVPAQPNTCDHCSPESLAHRGYESQPLRDILAEAILMKDAIVEQNKSLAAELRRTRHQLHEMRSFMDFAAGKLQEAAARRFRSIDSDTASEGELEDLESNSGAEN